MFYFTCNESKIYESFTFWNKLQEKNELFHDILIYWDAPVCNVMCVVKIEWKQKKKKKLTAAWVVTVMLAWWDQTSSVSDFKT